MWAKRSGGAVPGNSATKCGLVWHTRKGNRFFDYDSGPVHRYLGSESIVHEVEQSLRRLDTDHIDLYITHWQDPTTPVEETMETLVMLRDQGKINSIGASNLSEDELRTYAATGSLDAIQEEYSMVKREHRDDAATHRGQGRHLDTELLLAGARAPLGQDGTGPDVLWRRSAKGQSPFLPRQPGEGRPPMEAIAPVAEGHGGTKAQVVIAWTMQQSGITFALCAGRAIPIRREERQSGTHPPVDRRGQRDQRCRDDPSDEPRRLRRTRWSTRTEHRLGGRA